jgi:hypothetical protein
MIAVDLSSDNRLPVLLGEREKLKAAVQAAKARLDEIDAEVRQKIGDAERATLSGWRIEYRRHHRNGYSVPPQDYRTLRIERAAPDGRAALQDLMKKRAPVQTGY